MPLHDRALRFWTVVELRIRSRLNALLVRELYVDFGVVSLDREWAKGISYIIHSMDTNDGKLYIVATPIGNLGDITQRALKVLETSDAVYAEDTRVTGKLLAAFGLKKSLCRLDENTIRSKTDEVIERIRAGEVIAYCTDAGMPGVSDPGSVLIAAAREASVPCEILPGASAGTLAYVASGFSCPNHYFGCFFPRKKTEQIQTLDSLASLNAALIFYESPHRLLDSLCTINEALPQRRVCVCRELTKLHEEVYLGTPAEALSHFATMEEASGIKGEIVIVIDAAGADEARSRDDDVLNQANELICRLIADGERVKSAAKIAASELGIAKNLAYEMALSAKETQDDA